MWSCARLLVASLLLLTFSTVATAETYDVDPTTGYRMDRYRAPVPESIPGGVTVDSKTAMAAHLNGDWVFIDVYPPNGTDGWLEEGGSLELVEPVNFFGEDTDALANSREDSSEEESEDTALFPAIANIYLIDQSGNELDIGTVEFTPVGDDKNNYTVNATVESPAFSDQFLSMRPFDCIAEAAEWYCYLPYPYEIRRTISKDDLTELEYQLLFIWKSPKDFGIDAWNGIYYQLSLQEDGSLSGTLLQGDLNVLASPPEPNSHPIELSEFIDEGGDKRRYPKLIIRP